MQGAATLPLAFNLALHTKWGASPIGAHELPYLARGQEGVLV